MKTLTPAQSARLSELQAMHSAHESACDRISPRKRSGWRVITPEENAQI